MTIWFTSDLHLGHEKVIEFCKRPFIDVNDMNHALCRKWNAVVKPEDTVYVLGDLSFQTPRVGMPLVKGLLGRKILVQGNHDKWSHTQYLAAGFVEVVQEAVIKLAGFLVRLSHYPYAPLVEEDAPSMRYLDRRPPRNGYEWLLCGHVHERWKTREKMVNVGVDVWDYAPVSQGSIESIFMKKEED